MKVNGPESLMTAELGIVYAGIIGGVFYIEWAMFFVFFAKSLNLFITTGKSWQAP